MAGLVSLYECIAEPMVRVRDLFDARLRSERDYVNGLCRQVSRYRGKMLRPALVLLSGQASGRITDQHVGLATVVEIIHMTTLVHDDVLDESDLRRRMVTINHMEGNEAAVLLGDYLMSQAFCLCNELNLPEAANLIGVATREICEGELMQIHHRGDYGLNEAEYFQIVSRKTGTLIRLCCEIGARYGGADDRAVDALCTYGHELGVAFQIADDVLDIVGTQEQAGKTLGRDLDKGKLTLPVIHFLSVAQRAQREEALSVLNNGVVGRNARLREMMAATDSIDYALSLARGMVCSAQHHLAALPAGLARDALHGVADFAIDRQF